MIATAGGAPPITRDGAREAARRELSKAIYHRDDPPWPLRVFNAIQRWLQHLLSSIGRHSPGGGAGAFLLLLAVALLVAIAWWRVGPLRRDQRLPGAVLDERRTSAADRLREALAAASAGRWGDAVVARMRALAQQLEEDGVLDPRPGRTADELAAEVASFQPPAAALMRVAARTFDDVAYGERPATEEMYDAVVAAAAAARPAHRILTGGLRR